MNDLVSLLAAACAGGLVATAVRIPPLVGFLVAGFALNAAGVEAPNGLETAADIGVAVLLFTIGLKFDVRVLARREVWLTTSAHLLVTVAIVAGTLAVAGAVGLGLADGLDLPGVAVLAIGLSFSSTVFVIKVLELNNASRSLYGTTAIGILVLQDLVAVAAVTLSTSEPPSPWAAAVLLLLPARPLLSRIVAWSGRGELTVPLALLLALGPGYVLFDQVGLKGDLGALVIGLLLAADENAEVLRRTLTSIKEILLVGFFLSLGFVGVPGAEHLALAGVLVLLVPLKTLGFTLLLARCGLRNRSAALGGLALGNFSEFGLVLGVAAVDADMFEEDLLVVVATAVAMSFVLAAVGNALQERLLPVLHRFLGPEDPERLHEADRIIDAADADAIVLGLGRVGTSAYLRLHDEYGLRVLGVDSDGERVAGLRDRGFDVIEADATDTEFWVRLESVAETDVAILAMPFHGANRLALRRLRETGFDGFVGVVVQFDDDAEDAREHGADVVLHLYDGSGAALADETMSGIDRT